MADNLILRYLPPGWTEEKYQNPTGADLEALPDEELQKVTERQAAEAKLISAQNIARINERRIARGAPPIPRRPASNNAATRDVTGEEPEATPDQTDPNRSKHC